MWRSELQYKSCLLFTYRSPHSLLSFSLTITPNPYRRFSLSTSIVPAKLLPISTEHVRQIKSDKLPTWYIYTTTRHKVCLRKLSYHVDPLTAAGARHTLVERTATMAKTISPFTIQYTLVNVAGLLRRPKQIIEPRMQTSNFRKFPPPTNATVQCAHLLAQLIAAVVAEGGGGKRARRMGYCLNRITVQRILLRYGEI